MNPEPCIRSRACNAGFPCFIIVRPEELSELGRKYGVELSDDTVAAIVRFREGYDELRQKVLADPPQGMRCASRTAD